MADPGFTRGRQRRGDNLFFGINFAENCMKRKEMEARLGARIFSDPLDPPPKSDMFGL